MKKIAIFGYGNIGSGVARAIEINADTIREALGEGMEVKYALDLRDFPDDPLKDRIVKDVDIIVNDPEIEVVCETMGGKEPAFTFSKKALMAGKSVCTSNKELVAAHGPELLKIAAEHGCSYLFEASVGGGIPLIRTFNLALAHERIQSIAGILNGTTNYILTRMSEHGMGYEEALNRAKELGYAEPNPTADVEGHDTGRKIAILSSLMTGKTVEYDDLHVEGITGITEADLKCAEELGMTIRLLGQAELTENRDAAAMAAPFMVPTDHPLALVKDVFNAILVNSNLLGDTMYYGKGAGKLPTASAIVSDCMEALRNKGRTLPCRWEDTGASLADFDKTSRAFLVRVKKADLDKAKEMLPVKQALETSIDDQAAFVTEVMTEGNFAEIREKIDIQGAVRIL